MIHGWAFVRFGVLVCRTGKITHPPPPGFFLQRLCSRYRTDSGGAFASKSTQFIVDGTRYNETEDGKQELFIIIKNVSPNPASLRNSMLSCVPVNDLGMLGWVWLRW